MTAVAGAGRGAVDENRQQFRYGAVFALVLTLLLFTVLSPEANWARALGVALAGGALTVAVATSRARRAVRRNRARAVAGVAIVVVVGIATGVFSAAVAYIVLVVLIACIPIALGGGVLRLIREEGVTVQAVAGALAIYLVVGLLFGSAVAFLSHVQSEPFFAQGKNVTDGDEIYYSLTVLTTTGFGDYTPATPVGHALAVLEMLTGQLYLVTVIGILVGNFASRRVSADRDE